MALKARLGMAGYARILHSIKQRRATKRDIVERGLCGHTAAVRIVSSFHALGLVHVCAWRAGYDMAYQPVYGYGGMADAPTPTKRSNGRPINGAPIAPKPSRIAPELLSFFTAFEALQAPCSLNDMMQECGLSWHATRRLLDALQECGLTHIVEWRRKSSGGIPEALHQWGEGKNAERCPLSRTEINRRYRESKRLRTSPMFFMQTANLVT